MRNCPLEPSRQWPTDLVLVAGEESSEPWIKGKDYPFRLESLREAGEHPEADHPLSAMRSENEAQAPVVAAKLLGEGIGPMDASRMSCEKARKIYLPCMKTLACPPWRTCGTKRKSS